MANAKQFTVNGYTLAALEWNPSGPIKVIASHGWLDNAATFNRLAPLLGDCHIIALDLAGHGHSDHKPPQGTYNVWDDLTDILAVANALEWPSFHLLGHSRGAIISLILAAAKPDRVLSLVLLDGILPKPVTHAETAKQLGQFLDDNLKGPNTRHRGYESIAQAVAVRCRAVAMSEESATPIVSRGLLERDGKYYWRTDPRLMNASAVKLTDEHNRALLAAVTAPNVLFSAEGGIGAFNYFDELLEDFPRFQPIKLDGSHHFHLEQPALQVAETLEPFYLSINSIK